MGAREELYAAVMSGGYHSPERSERASACIDAYRAEVLRETRDTLLGDHVPHRSGSTDCIARCDRAHPNVDVCNSDDYRWPCPTVDKVNGLLSITP